MTLHFVHLVLGNETYKEQVSTEGCADVDDFRGAIKNKLPHLLNGYNAVQLTLLQPDGITEIDPETLVTDLKEIPWNPLVVTVEELLFDADEWVKLKEWNQKTNARIHDADLPKTSTGKYFVIIPHADYNQETISFFKTIGVKAQLYIDEIKLEVKDEVDLF
ncbi:hypothetical protein O5D80_000832 [Batrachochytrium dendrobatidis]|nr:hypothetical protein O5D80_000832 [Batrachochytrium dendrobatidis]